MSEQRVVGPIYKNQNGVCGNIMDENSSYNKSACEGTITAIAVAGIVACYGVAVACAYSPVVRKVGKGLAYVIASPFIAGRAAWNGGKYLFEKAQDTYQSCRGGAGSSEGAAEPGIELDQREHGRESPEPQINIPVSGRENQNEAFPHYAYNASGYNVGVTGINSFASPRSEYIQNHPSNSRSNGANQSMNYYL